MPSALPRPELLDPDRDPVEAAGPRRDGYQLRYALRGAPDAYAVQRVETEVRYMSGDETVLCYRGHYWEFFRFGEADEPAVDVHAFGLREDGWTPGDLRRLTRELGIKLPLWSAGPTRIVCSKRFRLGLGEVEDGQVLLEGPYGEFGYLAEAEDDPSAASVELVNAGERVPLKPASPLPSGRAPTGRGRFVEAEGWLAEETLSCTLAPRKAELEAGRGYQPAPLGQSPQ